MSEQQQRQPAIYQNEGDRWEKAGEYSKQGRLRDALVIYRELKRERSDEGLFDLNIGCTLIDLGQTLEGEQHLRASVRCYPTHPLFCLTLMKFLVREKRIEDALAEGHRFQKAAGADHEVDRFVARLEELQQNPEELEKLFASSKR